MHCPSHAELYYIRAIGHSPQQELGTDRWYIRTFSRLRTMPEECKNGQRMSNTQTDIYQIMETLIHLLMLLG